MKKYFKFIMISFFMISLLTILGCNKVSDVNTFLSYELRFTNTSDNLYLVEINGISKILQGNTFNDYTLEKGTYAWKATQQSGYVLFPTI